MKLKIFTKPDCPNCPAAKILGKKLETQGAKVDWFDLSEDKGLSEAVYFDVLSTPTLIVIDDKDNEIKSWRGEVPQMDLILKELKLKK